MRVEPQGAGDRFEYLLGGIDVAALLQPGVPGHPDPGELSDLLAAQTRRAPPPGLWQADLFGRDALTTAAQERGQFPATDHVPVRTQNSSGHAATVAYRRAWYQVVPIPG